MIRFSGLGVDTRQSSSGEKVMYQRANGFRAISSSPMRLFTQPQSNFDLSNAIINIKIRDGADRNMLFVIDDEPELSPVAVNVVAVKNGQELGHAIGIWTVQIVMPDLVIAFPMENFRGIVHRGAAEKDPFTMYRHASLRMSRGIITLCFCHKSPISCAKLVPAARCPTAKASASV